MKRLLCAAAATLLAALTAPATAQGGLLADLRVVNRNTGQVAPTYVQGGRIHVVGTPGERYAVQVTNRTAARILAVVSVDGVNVVTGETAAPDQNGYVLGPYQSYDIAGWRKNSNEIAAFYFTNLGDSYAGRTGRPANVGVIGLAVYREWQPPRPRPLPAPVPRSDSFGGLTAPSAAAPAESARAEAADAASGESRAADSIAGAPYTRRAPERIGTGHGERERSDVTLVDFRRASSQPSEVLAIHYDTYANLAARGIIPGTPRVVEPQPFPGMRWVPDPRG